MKENREKGTEKERRGKKENKGRRKRGRKSKKEGERKKKEDRGGPENLPFYFTQQFYQACDYRHWIYIVGLD